MLRARLETRTAATMRSARGRLHIVCVCASTSPRFHCQVFARSGEVLFGDWHGRSTGSMIPPTHVVSLDSEKDSETARQPNSQTVSHSRSGSLMSSMSAPSASRLRANVCPASIRSCPGSTPRVSVGLVSGRISVGLVSFSVGLALVPGQQSRCAALACSAALAWTPAWLRAGRPASLRPCLPASLPP